MKRFVFNKLEAELLADSALNEAEDIRRTIEWGSYSHQERGRLNAAEQTLRHLARILGRDEG